MDGRDRVRTIVILADGTGNAFKSQESNIWRLYAALDLTSPEQVAYYIKGVGTSGFKPLALLDGAIGFGVPANVRKLYRFLCWNWHPEVEIYLFGFSRGAFTVRTLIGLIDSQGLVPIEFEDGPVSREEMKRNVMAAWRAYRARKATWSNSLPTIPITRAIRDLILSIYQRLRGHRRYAEIRETMRTQKRIDARIRFVGLFDTVEAYGVPIEEMRTAIDFAIWPISFRNRVLSQKVDFARHALALDDERTTFHPLRFDMTNEPEWAKDGRIKEVWFSGVHSDVGAAIRRGRCPTCLWPGWPTRSPPPPAARIAGYDSCPARSMPSASRRRRWRRSTIPERVYPCSTGTTLARSGAVPTAAAHP